MSILSGFGLSEPDSPMRSSRKSQNLQFVNRPGRGDLSCWLALPGEIIPSRPPLVAVHGIRRDARAQAVLLRTIAVQQRRPVIAPLFDEEEWRTYQLVVLKKRADLALISLMAELREDGLWQTDTFDLCGFSGGAQFAHRFAMLFPHLVSSLSVASAGWYTFPDDAPFPYGLGTRPKKRAKEVVDWGPSIEAGLKKFLTLPIQVFVGSLDCLQDANVRSGPEINRQQGTNRVERGRNWVEAVRDYARERGLASDITFKLLEGCPHNFRKCVEDRRLDRLIGRLSSGREQGGQWGSRGMDITGLANRHPGRGA